MIFLLPIAHIIRYIALGYAAIVVVLLLIIYPLSGPISPISAVKLALLGGVPIQIALLAFVNWGWRWLWRRAPVLNRMVFPDIGGVWRMEIDWTRGQTSGTVEAQATIIQSFTALSLSVEAPGSTSQTLSVIPRRDPISGVASLHYLYSVTPHASRPDPDPPYTGAAILAFSEAGAGVLRGNYWTSAMTQGHFRLTRLREP